jgi:hypothetical protein
VLSAVALALACGVRREQPPLQLGFSAQLPAAPAYRWSRAFGSSLPTGAVSVNAVLPQFVGGSFQGALTGCVSLLARGGPDGFVARLDDSGACQWAAQIGGVGASTTVMALATDGDAIYAAGSFTRTVEAGDVSLTSAGGTDGFLVAYSADGTLKWARGIGEAGQDKAYGVAVSGGVVAVTGYAGGSGLLLAAYRPDGSPLWTHTASGQGAGIAGRPGGFYVVSSAGITAYNLDGISLWAQTVPGATLAAVAADADGLVVTGTIADGGAPAVWLARYSADGEPVWARSYRAGFPIFGGAGRAVALGSDSIALTGSITDDVDFGGGALAGGYTADVFVAEFSASGVHRWSQRYPATFRDEGEGIAYDGDGLTVGGVFANSIDFGGGTLSGTGATKGFVAAFGRAAVATETAQPTSTATATTTETATSTATNTPQPTATAAPADTVTATATATSTAIPTATSTETETATPTDTAASMPTETATPADTAVPWRICDVTRNGGISSLDATRVLQWVAGLAALDAEQQRLGDASGNGQLSTLDAVLILQWVAGLHDAAPRCGTAE